MCWAAPALASIPKTWVRGHICERVEPDMFIIDGRLDDWRGFKPRKVKEGRDAGFEFRCAYDSGALHIAINIADERLVRTRQAVAKAEDRLVVKLSVDDARPLSLTFLPGAPTAKPKRVSAPGYVEIQDSLQEHGWSVEISLPMKRLDDWYRSVAFLQARILYYDVDMATAGAAEDVVGVDGRLCFSEAEATLKAFMKSARLRWKDIKIDALANLDPGTGPERLVHGGKIVGVIADAFVFMELPVADKSDVLSVQTVDFDGAGREAIVAEFRQRGENGSRNLVGVWFVDGQGRFHQALTFEVSRELSDGRTLVNRWGLVPRGSRRPAKGKRPKKVAGMDILVEFESVAGWQQENFQEAPEPMIRPILKPWDESTAMIYYFEGTAAYNEPAIEEEPVKKKRGRRGR